jgi:hypothetical protein
MVGLGIHISFGLLEDLLNHVEFPSFDSSDVSSNMINLRIEQHSEFGSWLSQANHIFSRLGINSDFTDYGAPEIISWHCSPFNLLNQRLCSKLFSVSTFWRYWNTPLQAIYLSAQKKTFKSDHHHSDCQIVLPIGPSIHRVLNVSARRRPLNWDSPLLSSTQPFSHSAGMPMFMPRSVNSTEPRALIQTVKMSPGT